MNSLVLHLHPEPIVLSDSGISSFAKKLHMHPTLDHKHLNQIQNGLDKTLISFLCKQNIKNLQKQLIASKESYYLFT